MHWGGANVLFGGAKRRLAQRGQMGYGLMVGVDNAVSTTKQHGNLVLF
jgi:hypothetical protein